MGHVEPGSAVTEPPTLNSVESEGRLRGLADVGLWPTWRRLTRLFPGWSFLFSGLTTPGAWTSVGNDLLSGFRRNGSTGKAFALTGTLSGSELALLADMAALNLRRQEAILRIVVVSYATVPLTIITITAQLTSAGLLDFVRDNFTAVAQFMGVLLMGVLIYAVGTWRARQMVSVLELIRIERGWQQEP